MTTPSFSTARRIRPDAFDAGLSAADAVRLLGAAGDLSLIVDADGVVWDAAGGVDATIPDADLQHWIGRPWLDLVTVESRPKIEEMLRDGAGDPRWRQVNHSIASGDLPVRYATISLGDGRRIAIGRDLRPQAAAQQRLLQAQQALERDYLRLRQAESRYRLLFDQSRDAVLIVDAGTRRIREANAAAHRLFGMRAGALVNQPVGSIAAAESRDALIAHLGAAGVSESLAPLRLPLARKAGEASVTARAFREGGVAHWLLQLSTAAGSDGADAEETRLADLVARMPDAFVLTDSDLAIVTANAAFADLAHAPSLERLTGMPLGEWLGRPGIDLQLIVAQVRDGGSAANVATILRGPAGEQIDVEVSAVSAGDGYGFVMRDISRRLRAAPEPGIGLPGSVDQLTELVGRMSLKEIVRESTDMIERLCIEAALAYTDDNRASAAEILGVSRQSLYSKLHRHGLGSLIRGDE